MAKKPVRYYVVDAFTDSAFKGNPAAVCLLEEERDEQWLQAVAREFNASETCYLTRLPDSAESPTGSVPRFRLRLFAPLAEVKLCGHATLAASHFLFAYDLVKSNTIEFLTLSGILRAKRVSNSFNSQINGNNRPDRSFLIELDFPVVPIKEYDGADEIYSAISKSLNIASVVEIHKTTTGDDLLVVLPSGEAVVEIEPNFDEMQKCPGKGIIITGVAPSASGFDFFTRFFDPKHGVNEASRRSGLLNLHLDEKNQRVLLRGKAIAVMEGFLLV